MCVLIQKKQAIIKVHKDYINAGSDIIITSSYQANIEGFKHYNLNKNDVSLKIAESVDLAFQSLDENTNKNHKIIVGSIG